VTTLIAGAGFSKWAAKLPLARELFDFRVKPFGVREAKKLASLRDFKTAWDGTHPSEPAEAFIDFALRQGRDSGKLVIWYVVRRLSDPYIWEEWHSGRWRRHVLMLDEHRKSDKPGVQEARAFLVGVLGTLLDGIVTTNYDLLVEYALGTTGFNYGIPGEQLVGRGPYPLSHWLHPVTLTGAVSLAKVHGSISWDTSARYTDGRRGMTGNALILAPVPNKKPPPELSAQWDLAARLLRRASSIVVFGFAFNPYDSEFLDHLRAESTSVKHVLLIDTRPKERSARDIWPNASLETLPPPPQSEPDIRKWLRRSA